MSQVRAGGAYVELTARSAQFLKGLEAAQKRLKSFGASRDWSAPNSQVSVSRQPHLWEPPRSLYQFR